MKLLIVDDEAFTRSGIIGTIDWRSLEIDEIFQAEDGVDGVREAGLCNPDIILSDIRMPRMDGIKMLEKIRAAMPDVVCIFMSGYSDKEYLKSALRLRAVSYIEKPIDIEEVKAAVTDAVNLHKEITLLKQAENYQNTVSAYQLSRLLTTPYSTIKDDLASLAGQYSRQIGEPDIFSCAASVIIQSDPRSRLLFNSTAEAGQKLGEAISSSGIHVICAEKNSNLYVFHLFRASAFTDETLREAAGRLHDLVPDDIGFYISAGRIVSGLSEIYDSYSSAVIELQNCFFFEPGTVLFAGDAKPLPDDETSFFESFITEAVSAGDREKAFAAAGDLYEKCIGSRSLLKRVISSLYSRMIGSIASECRKRHISSSFIESAAEKSEQCFSYNELHLLFISLLTSYFNETHSISEGNSSVYILEQYIKQNYSNPLLSIKEISDHASLSVSYACKLYKNTTGKTLNQFLTETRIDKARELLLDPSNNISDIALLSGYNDSNYFSKIFRKTTGLSPSEYRKTRLNQ